ncbi:MAG TPA: lamin tail domain-containing protein [Candidatus Baltobacteraceae bacterium]|nr:lamin tail domain-containing protein [Candidatus Baltobacteraceae bacterium]
MHRFLAACSLLFLLPFSVRAAFVSEVAWAGSSASLADEWLEICGAPGADLSGWSIEGASASPLALPAGSVIPASGAYLVANYADSDARSTLAVAPDLVTTSVGLSNSSLFLTLRDASGASVDVVGAAGSAPYAGTSGEMKASMERTDAAADGSGPSAWTTASASVGFDAGAPESGTPGACAASAPEPIPVPVSGGMEPPPVPEPESPTDSATGVEETSDPAPTSDAPAEPMGAVRISELYPSPASGEAEWLELVNPSSTGEFLDGWTVEDARGTKTPLEGLLLPWTRFVLRSPKGSLNNDGDIIVLRDRLGRAVDRVEYPKTPRGEAFMRIELQDAFVMTLTPTPGAANVFTEADVPEEAPSETMSPVIIPIQNPPPLSSRPERSAADGTIRSETDPSASLGMTKIVEAEPKKTTATKPASKPAAKIAKKSPASRYKGASYAATVVVPPGVYSKTRAFVQRGGTIEELRLSKGPVSPWNVGDRITFVAQAKTEGAVAFLLANPNSVRTIGSASATFATAESWPDEAGGYRFTAEIASIRGDALEVKLGGVEGDVLAPTGTVSALKPGDLVQVEGFIAPGPRPRVVLPYALALRLFKAHLQDDAADPVRSSRLPTAFAVGLTAAAGGVGLLAYLRMQRLRRLALTQAPVEEGVWE